MAKKEFTYQGKTLDELKTLNHNQLMDMFTARKRRTMKRGFNDAQKKLLKDLSKNKRNIKTHEREMIVLPEMVGKTIGIHNGKEFINITIMPEMIGHVLGEFAYTRKLVSHSAPGVGATKSSASVSVR